MGIEPTTSLVLVLQYRFQSTTPDHSAIESVIGILLDEPTKYTMHALTLLKKSSQMYMIFCGAPRHLIGVFGRVKIAFPSSKACRHFQVSWTVCAE